MKLLVVADQQGRIVSISKPGDVGDSSSGIGGAGVLPGSGHEIHYVELPEDLQERPLLEIHHGFRLDVRTGQAKLVPAERFVEPFRVEAGATERQKDRKRRE